MAGEQDQGGKVRFKCPECGRAFAVPANLSGRRARCESCGTAMQIPAATRQVAPAGAPVRRSQEPMAAPADRVGLDGGSVGAVAKVVRSSRDDGETEAPDKGASPPRKARTEGPWCPPVRNAAIVLTYLALLVIAITSNRPEFQADSRGPLNLVMVWALVPGALAMLVSVLGATLSYLKGNRQAFSSSGRLVRLAWFAAMIVLVPMIGVFSFDLAHRPKRAELLPLPQTPQAELATFEELIQARIDSLDELAALLEPLLPTPDPEKGLEPWPRVKEARDEVDRVRARAETVPLPTRDQVRQLKARYHAPYRAANGRLLDAARAARARYDMEWRGRQRLLRLYKGGQPVEPSPWPDLLDDIRGHIVPYLDTYDMEYPADGSDATNWYAFVFGVQAGTRSGDPSGADEARADEPGVGDRLRSGPLGLGAPRQNKPQVPGSLPDSVPPGPPQASGEPQ